ncbi:serine/threonine protein kinase SAT4 [Sugiyamaella lignohabitans]|uniref:non-specific serine/threonine protein kinase n=1 Tax=Sugiyamaella lignohabitans TaxID=796027 RepID=A0A161HHM5_9ASCO|nr:serine/threonine protein kinase SAT4 [Sugiyamaella lignohabitans]ANB15560.1 serine/threonine protein kinase SAT4 [Sugiyamaella lignohabitans]
MVSIGASHNGGVALAPTPQMSYTSTSSGTPPPPASRPVSAMAKLKTMFGPKKAAMPFGERSPVPSRTPSPLPSPISGPTRSPTPSIHTTNGNGNGINGSVNGHSSLNTAVNANEMERTNGYGGNYSYQPGHGNGNLLSVTSTASHSTHYSTLGSTLSPKPSNNTVMSVSSANSSTATLASTTKRIILLENGSHEHYLKSTRRQEKLGRMIRDIVGTGQKVRQDAVSAMPELVDKDNDDLSSRIADLSLMSGLVSQIEKGEKDVQNLVRDHGLKVPPLQGSGSTANSSAPKSLLQKYGKCQEIIGKGAYGVVRVCHKYDHVAHREVLFAVKEFKRRSSETEQNFSKRLTSEFCISSSLHHANIIQTLDLMKDSRGVCCQVMEYCAGGDLYSLILASEGGLEVVEADCFFKQIMRGVVYMHSMGVAHCDLKPENILLTPTGVVKISDFGNGECFRMAWESEIHMLSGVCGSRPYIAPEEFRDEQFDPRAVDVWATGIIYMAMRTGSYLWQVAEEDDEFYAKYLQRRKHKNGYEPIESLKRSKCKNVIYSILDPKPNRRITGKQVLNSEWGRSIQVCESGERGH